VVSVFLLTTKAQGEEKEKDDLEQSSFYLISYRAEPLLTCGLRALVIPVGRCSLGP